jgi:hypothetical protein
VENAGPGDDLPGLVDEACFSSNIPLTHKEKRPVNRKSRNLFPWNAALFPDP